MTLQDILASAGDGFGVANDVVLEDLQKALTAGYGTDAATFTGGRALMPESLDSTLVSVLHTQDEAKLFKALKKEPVSSTVHQYVKRTEVGSDDGAWVSEGGASQEADQTIARQTIDMKYLQTKRRVTLQMATAKSIEDAQALEQNAGALWIIRNIETKLYTGDSALTVEKPDGLNKVLTTNVIDLRGKDATSSDFEDKVTEGSRAIRDSFGKPSLMLSSTMAMEDIQKLLRDRIRVPSGVVDAGSNVFNSYPTKFGKPVLEDNVFIKEGGQPAASSLTALRPGAPTINSQTTSTATTLFTAATAGTYWYKVTCVNKYGESAATAAGSGTAIAAGEINTINVSEGSPVATSYRIYRSKKDAADASDCRFAFEVARATATQDIVDRDTYLPGTSRVYLLTMDEIYNAIEWDQFLPMMRFTLYPTAAAEYPFLMLLFGALNVKKEEQHAQIINIGYSGDAWF
jgi:hypothetical protein